MVENKYFFSIEEENDFLVFRIMRHSKKKGYIERKCVSCCELNKEDFQYKKVLFDKDFDKESLYEYEISEKFALLLQKIECSCYDNSKITYTNELFLGKLFLFLARL